MKPETVLTFIALGAAGWLLTKFFDKASEALKPAANIIGDTIAAVTLPPPVSIKAAVLLPSGARIAFDDVLASGGSFKYAGNDKYDLVYKNVRYNVTGRIDDTTYRAVFA